MKYGKITDEHTLDSEGSTMEESYTLVNGHETDIRRHYEMRVRVHSEKEELAEYLRFRDQTRAMTKVEFRIEHTAIGNEQGFYYVIKCWTDVITK